jgi:hypothetical protein
VALLIARIPGAKAQQQALADMFHHNGDLVSYRTAKKIVHEHYMLRLRGAPFPPGDADLLPKAGACGNCPKKTGNQPELFGDVKSADVCTDLECFTAKAKAHGKRLIADATKAGRPTVTGKHAREAAPNGVDRYLRGYVKASEKTHHDSYTKTARSLVGQDVQTTLLQCPTTGKVIEVYPDSVVAAAARKGRPKQRLNDSDAKRRNEAKIERKFREALYDKIRNRLPAPTLKEMAKTIFDRVDHDTRKVLCRIRGFDVPQVKRYGTNHRNYDAIGETIDDMDTEALQQFVNDCVYAREMQVSSWSNAKPERLLAAAKACKVNVAAVRKSVQPKKKAGKKKVAKKKARKKAASKKTSKAKAARKPAKKKAARKKAAARK